MIAQGLGPTDFVLTPYIGRAEYLFVGADGSVTAYLNLGGPDSGANAAKVSWLPQGVIASGVGANRNQVAFADLNGDGKAILINSPRPKFPS